MNTMKFDILNTQDNTYKRISRFIESHNLHDSYPAKDLIRWHSILTKSCSDGVSKYLKDNEIDLEKEWTIPEFIERTKLEFGSDVIKKLEQRMIDKYSQHE
jgi:hypothetical protein